MSAPMLHATLGAFHLRGSIEEKHMNSCIGCCLERDDEILDTTSLRVQTLQMHALRRTCTATTRECQSEPCIGEQERKAAVHVGLKHGFGFGKIDNPTNPKPNLMQRLTILFELTRSWEDRRNLVLAGNELSLGPPCHLPQHVTKWSESTPLDP